MLLQRLEGVGRARRVEAAPRRQVPADQAPGPDRQAQDAGGDARGVVGRGRHEPSGGERSRDTALDSSPGLMAAARGPAESR